MARLTSTRIRGLVLLVLATILVVPVVTVLAIELLGGSERRVIERATTAAVRAAESVTARDHLDAIAREHGVRLWLVDPATRATLFDSDHQPRQRSDLGMPSLGMRERPLDALEARRAPPAEREHAAIATAIGRSQGCATYDSERLLVCEAAARTSGGHVVIAQRAAPRVASRLADAREGLLLLAGLVLAGGAVAAAWLVRRLTRPLDALATQVAARTRGEVASISVPDAPREIADVGAAVDRLAGRLEEQHRLQAIAAADLAHELKSPLARIRLALDAGDLDATARAALETNAKAALVAIDRIVAELLEIARAEAGLREEAREPTDLLALAKQVIADRPPPPGIIAVANGAATVVEVAPAAITRALGHLLDNAYAFARAHVTVEVSASQAFARILVRDDGPGIPADLQDRLFDRFVSRRRGGTGLGLAFVRAVAEAHHGTTRCGDGPGASIVVELAPVHTKFTSV